MGRFSLCAQGRISLRSSIPEGVIKISAGPPTRKVVWRAMGSSKQIEPLMLIFSSFFRTVFTLQYYGICLENATGFLSRNAGGIL